MGIVRGSGHIQEAMARIVVLRRRFGYSGSRLQGQEMADLAANDAAACLEACIGRNGFQELVDWSRSGEEANARVGALAARCDYHYSIDLPRDGVIDAMSITFFNGGPIMHALTEGTVGGQEEPRIRF